MWEFISAAILCLFAIFGFVAFIKKLIFKIYKPKNDNTFLVIDFKEKDIDLEYTLRSWINRIKWMGKITPECIFIIDKNLSDEQKHICNLICKEYEMIKILSPAELYEIINN